MWFLSSCLYNAVSLTRVREWRREEPSIIIIHVSTDWSVRQSHGYPGFANPSVCVRVCVCVCVCVYES